MSANRTGIIRVSLTFAAQAEVEFDETLEVALDCHVCQRRCRTVIFRSGEPHGLCTPTKHAFPGGNLSVVALTEGDAHVALYYFDYDFQPFRDARYPDEQRYGNVERGAPTWARVSFTVTCPACGERSQHSTQTNLERPTRSLCKCGGVLYVETDEMPDLSWVTKATE